MAGRKERMLLPTIVVYLSCSVGFTHLTWTAIVIINMDNGRELMAFIKTVHWSSNKQNDIIINDLTQESAIQDPV